MKRMLLTLAAAVAVAAPAAAQTATWDIDTAHSSAQFSVKHMMVSTVRGDFGKTTGSIEFDGKNPASVKVNATIDATTITTRNEARDKHLKSADFFDVEKFPTITFVSTKAEAAGAGKLKVTGNLTMHGVTKEVVLMVDGPTPEIKGSRGETRIGASATTSLNRQDFGVSWSRALDGGGVVVSDQVQVTIDLELVKKAAS